MATKRKHRIGITGWLYEISGYALISIGGLWGLLFREYDRGAWTVVLGLAAHHIHDRTKEE